MNIPAAYEPPKAAKEHQTTLSVGVPTAKCSSLNTFYKKPANDVSNFKYSVSNFKYSDDFAYHGITPSLPSVTHKVLYM